MKKLLGLMLVLAATSASAQWYVGGNLHSKTMAQWHEATRANKQATLADMVGKVLKQPNPAAIRPKVVEVEACVNEVASEKSLRHLAVAEIVVGCMIQLKYIG